MSIKGLLCTKHLIIDIDSRTIGKMERGGYSCDKEANPPSSKKIKKTKTYDGTFFLNGLCPNL